MCDSNALDLQQLSEQNDNLGRDQIVDELDKNLFVIAGAGSGKTTMLVSRMVAMVEAGRDISKICAITFTKKAAAEFLERFQNLLRERTVLRPVPTDPSKRRHGDLADPTEITIARCKKALENIDLCFTGTIDAFCNLVLSEYPNNAGIPSASSVVQEDEEIELYKKEYEKIANDENSSLKEKFDAFNLLFQNASEVFAKSIKDVIEASHLNVVFTRPTVKIEEAFKTDLIDKYYAKIKGDLDIINNKTEADCPDSKPDYVERLNAFKKEYSALSQTWTFTNYSRLKQRIKSAIKGLRFISDPGLNFIDFRLMPKAGEYEYQADNQLDQYIKDVDAFTYKYAMDFLYSIAQVIRENLKKQGKLTFSEYLITFRDMIKKDMEQGMKLIDHIRNKHAFFLIDESQDTSPVQTELFFLLTSSCRATKMDDCKPIKGSLFIVGDPKQSIYEFRGADVDAYLHTKHLFEAVLDPNENEVVYLTKNFRSSLELCQYFNSTFATFENYEPIPTDCITVPPIKKDHLSGVYSCTTYLNAIDRIVDKQFIFDKKLYEREEKAIKNGTFNGERTYGFRKIQYQDIMLLTRSTTPHNKILSTLKERHIPVYCEGKYLISNCDAVRTIYAIYGYVVGEEGQLYNLLTSPLFNLSIEQLVGFTVDKLDDTEQIALFNAFEELKSVSNPVMLYEKISEHLKLYNYIDFMNIEYVLYVGEKLKQAYQSGDIVDTKDGAEFLKQFINNVVDRTMKLDYAPDAIYLANLHKVKGLERPIVIIIESGVNTSDGIDKYLDNNNGNSYIFKSSETKTTYGKYYDIEAGDDLKEIKQYADARHKTEAGRLDYVAVTRARNALIIENANRASVWKNIRFEGMDELPIVEEDSEKDLVYAENFDFDINIDFNKKRSYEIKKPSKEAKLVSITASEETEDSDDESSNDSLIKGTIVHRLMELLVSSKQTIQKDVVVDLILNEFSLTNAEYKTMLEKVYDQMMSGGYRQSNGQVVDLLKEIKDADCYCEVPFSFKEGYQIWQGEIDLLYIKDGKYYIIDYKTNADDDQLEEEYKDQIAAYKNALKKNLGVDAEASIYHIEI